MEVLFLDQSAFCDRSRRFSAVAAVSITTPPGIPALAKRRGSDENHFQVLQPRPVLQTWNSAKEKKADIKHPETSPKIVMKPRFVAESGRNVLQATQKTPGFLERTPLFLTLEYMRTLTLNLPTRPTNH